MKSSVPSGAAVDVSPWDPKSSHPVPGSCFINFVLTTSYLLVLVTAEFFFLFPPSYLCYRIHPVVWKTKSESKISQQRTTEWAENNKEDFRKERDCCQECLHSAESSSAHRGVMSFRGCCSTCNHSLGGRPTIILSVRAFIRSLPSSANYHTIDPPDQVLEESSCHTSTLRLSTADEKHWRPISSFPLIPEDAELESPQRPRTSACPPWWSSGLCPLEGWHRASLKSVRVSAHLSSLDLQ